MYCYRVTKYNPALRNINGYYELDDWTSISDIGSIFNNQVLTEADYLKIENSYIETAVSMLEEAQISFLEVTDIEQRGYEIALKNGQKIYRDQWHDVIRSMLREELWCRLWNKDSYVHIGYDYYMYVGVPIEPTASLKKALEISIYIEDFVSPYILID